VKARKSESLAMEQRIIGKQFDAVIIEFLMVYLEQ
jgi:hypothetical protein